MIPYLITTVVIIALLFVFKWAIREGKEERGEIERDVTDSIYEDEVFPKLFKRKP